jgi:SAM-dependent methyltransferase
MAEGEFLHMSEFIIKPHNTAVNNGVASGVKQHLSKINKEDRILDYGCGKLRNSKYLKEQGFINVDILDKQVQYDRLTEEELKPFNQIVAGDKLIENSYDAIFCTFVLNVIPNLIERNEVIENIQYLLKENGKAVFEVRKADDIFNAKYIEEYMDGYIVGKNSVKTFQKPYEIDELSDILKKHFSVVGSKKYSNSIVVTVEKNTNAKTAEVSEQLRMAI